MEARYKSATGLLPRQGVKKTSECITCVVRMGWAFHIQLVTDALLPTLGSRAYHNRELYKTQKWDECLWSVYWSPEILCCEVRFAVQAGVSHPSSVSAKWGLLCSEIPGWRSSVNTKFFAVPFHHLISTAASALYRNVICFISQIHWWAVTGPDVKLYSKNKKHKVFVAVLYFV